MYPECCDAGIHVWRRDRITAVVMYPTPRKPSPLHFVSSRHDAAWAALQRARSQARRIRQGSMVERFVHGHVLPGAHGVRRGRPRDA